jgi:hypothetical protein
VFASGGECAEAVDFQFRDELIGVEWLGTAGQADGAQVSGQCIGDRCFALPRLMRIALLPVVGLGGFQSA